MIINTLLDARIERDGNRWLVLHPSNDAVVAYCDTEPEAISFQKCLNRISKRYGAQAERLAPKNLEAKVYASETRFGFKVELAYSRDDSTWLVTVSHLHLRNCGRQERGTESAMRNMYSAYVSAFALTRESISAWGLSR